MTLNDCTYALHPAHWNEIFIQPAKQLPLPLLFLVGLGGFYLASCSKRFLTVMYQTFLASGTSLKRFGAGKGAWAVVTGATDGIGLEFAYQLAKAGFNIMLVSRTESKLKAVAVEIESKYNVSTKFHAIDFSKKGNDAAYASLESALSPLDIGVLVNNVGRSHDTPVYFDECPADEIDDIVEININATLKVTKIVLPGLLQRKGGLILNLGSFAGAFPTPMLSVYSATKAFLSVFSQTIGDEYAARGVVVQNINTYFVVSAMSKIRKASALIPTPNAYVKAVLSKIEVPCGGFQIPYTSTPYWSHSIMEYTLRMLNTPRFFLRYAHNMQRTFRARALKKKAREAGSSKKD